MVSSLAVILLAFGLVTFAGLVTMGSGLVLSFLFYANLRPGDAK